MKKIFFLIFLITISFASYSFNFTVMPTGFAVDLKKISTNEVFLINNTSEPLRLEIYPESDPIFGEKYNLNSNITIFPKIVALKPAGQQTVRFRVKASPNMEKGEYKSYLTFKELEQEIKTIQNKEDDIPSQNSSANLSLVTEISISVFGQNGEENVKGSLNNIKLEYLQSSIFISATAISEGDTSLKFFYKLELLNSTSSVEGLFGISSRNGKNDINISIPGKNLKGKKVNLTIIDQDGKTYYKKVHTL